MHPMLNIAIRAVRKGGNLIIQKYDAQKFAPEDQEKNQYFIKNIMKSAYRAIREIVFKSYPNHIILNTNENILLFNDKKIFWIINELNGKNNFLKNFPHFCIALAVIIKNVTELSVIYDPIRNDLFTAVRGQGAQLNGYRARCNHINTLEQSTVAVNLPIALNNHSQFYLKIYKKLLVSGISFRSTGSTVLDLAYVSSGKVDCLFDFNLNPRNFIVGKLQARESGCLISDINGGHENTNRFSTNLVSSPKLIRLIIEKIRECY